MVCNLGDPYLKVQMVISFQNKFQHSAHFLTHDTCPNLKDNFFYSLKRSFAFWPLLPSLSILSVKTNNKIYNFYNYLIIVLVNFSPSVISGRLNVIKRNHFLPLERLDEQDGGGRRHRELVHRRVVGIRVQSLELVKFAATKANIFH